MQQVPLTAVDSWTNVRVQSFWVPEVIDTLCPFCSRHSTFTFSSAAVADTKRKLVEFVSRCPACKESAQFFIMEPGDGRNPADSGCAAIYMYPESRGLRTPRVSSEQLGSDQLFRAYASTLESYNAGIWPAAATTCRRTLEGIAATLREKRTGNLFQDLEALFEERDFAEPLKSLTHLLRKGGNMGAHFDLEKEPDEEVCTFMLDLLEYFLIFLFRFPGDASRLERSLESLDG